MRHQATGNRKKAKVFGVALLCAVLSALSHSAEAQQAGKVAKIGILRPSRIPHFEEAFRQGLRDLGYVEGQNIVIEHRYADGKPDRYPELAADLVRLRVDVLLAGGYAAIMAAKRATSTIPIVMAVTADPVGAGFVASLARPGGNITGLSLRLGEGFEGKWLELLKEAVPRMSLVAVLGDPANPLHSDHSKEIARAAQELRLTIKLMEARGAEELERTFVAMVRNGAEGLVVLPSSLFNVERRRIVDLAAKNRLPAIYEHREFVDAGGLMSYGPDILDLFRRAATYVDRILKGDKPADLPVEQPTKFDLVVNLKAAKQIGLTIPPNVLARADKVMR
jgi:putative ABC transport system substrate-binding protein